MRGGKGSYKFLQKFRFILTSGKKLQFLFVLSEKNYSLLFCLNHLAEVQLGHDFPEMSL